MPGVKSFCSFISCHERSAVEVIQSTVAQPANSKGPTVPIYPAIQITSASSLTDMSSPKDFNGKVVLVTGSSGGIGAATVKYFASCGAQVVVNGRNQDNISRTAAECNSLSPNKYKALQIQADVTKDEDCRRIVESTVNHFGKLDILVNNAGGGAFGSIYDPKLMSTLEHMIKLDLRSVVLITQLAVPHLEKTKGNIVMISSTLSTKPNAHFMPYCIAKAAVDSFARCIALELGPKGIRVNTVNPTAVRTNFQAATGAGEILDGVLKHLEQTNPLGRIGTTEDVVNAIGYLASPEASFVTGASLLVDGASVHV